VWHCDTVHGRMYYLAFNRNSFATSVTLVEVCALLSADLVLFGFNRE